MSVLYAIAAGLLAIAVTFFSTKRLVKKNKDLEKDNDYLKAVQESKEKTIKAYSEWIDDKEVLRKQIEVVNNSDDLAELFIMLEEATTGRDRPDRSS